MDVMKMHLDIVHRNQEIIHSQWDEPLIEFPNMPVYPPPPIPKPYASLTPVELAAIGIGPSCAPINYDNDNDDEEANNDDEEMEDNK
jgi:hypothetical protein